MRLGFRRSCRLPRGRLGDYELHYVRDKDKREVDFLLTESRRPYLLLETKLSGSSVSPSLRYFRERLKPAYAVQLSRDDPQGPTVDAQGVLRLGAARFLSLL